ncbi:MAG: hypothetical protein JNL82_37930 [Myxococcales bacterium]|nr:hypothetical protein [Myxococcales bacterium]
MRELVLLIAAFASLDGCRGGDKADSKDPPVRDGKPVDGEPVDARPTPPDAAPDPCSATALRLEKAAPLTPWQVPAGCTPGGGGGGESFYRSEAELAARVPCPAGTALGVDFSRHAVLAVGYTLSPAGAGLGAFDDGKVITLVSRQQSPCPDAPMPMPMNTTAWFLVPAAGERTFATTACTIPAKCE